MECLLCLDDEPEDLVSPGAIEVGLWELPDDSELLLSPCPLPTTHSLSNILRDRDGSNWMPLLPFLLFFLANFPFFRNSSSFILIWLICFLRVLQLSAAVFSHSSSVFVVEREASRGLLLMDRTLADALTCSKKRTWTTTRSGRRSFCAACMDASILSFLTSISPHIFFLSTFVKLGCSWKHNNLSEIHSGNVFKSI